MSKAFVGQNTGGAAVEIIGKDEIFTGRSIKAPNHLRTYKEFATTSGTVSFGSELTWQPARALDKLGPGCIKLAHAAASGTSTGTDYPRFCDYVGFHALKDFKLGYSTSTLQQFNGHDLYRCHAHRARSEDSFAALVDGGLAADTAQRAANAADADHVIYIPLILLFWADQPKNWLPYINNVLSAPLEFKATLASINEVLETDGTATVCALSSARLRLEGAFVTNAENVRTINETLGKNGEFGVMGWARLVKTQERITGQSVASGVAAQQLSLAPFQKPYSDITVTYRDTTNIPSSSSESAVIDYTDYQKLARFKLRAANEDLVPDVDDKYARHFRQNMSNRGAVDEYIYRHSFSFAPDASDQLGFMSFDSIGTPEIDYTMAVSQSSCQADVLGNTHNIVTLHNNHLSMLFR